MTVLIVHDSQYGNGKAVAEAFQEVLGRQAEVTVGHIEELSPEETARQRPELIIAGAAVRKFFTSPAVKRWVRRFGKSLAQEGVTVPRGAVFLSHAMPQKMVAGRGRRLRRLMERSGGVERMYPGWFSARVQQISGPLFEGTVAAARERAAALLEWMHE